MTQSSSLKILLTSLALTNAVYLANASDQSTAKCQQLEEPSKDSGDVVNLMRQERELQVAVCFIETKSDVAEGLRRLGRLSDDGNEDAKFRLGWVHMRGEVTTKDNDMALSYLNAIKGELELSASILVATIYAQGSPSVPADRERSKTLFEAAAARLRQLRKEFKGPASTPPEVQKRLRYYEDWTLLYGISKEHGISISEQ